MSTIDFEDPTVEAALEKAVLKVVKRATEGGDSQLAILLHALIKDFEQFKMEVNQRLEKIDHRFDQMDNRFDQMDNRFDHMDKKFEQVDQKFERIDQKFQQVDQRFDRLENKVEKLADDVSEIREQMVTKEGLKRVLDENNHRLIQMLDARISKP